LEKLRKRNNRCVCRVKKQHSGGESEGGQGEKDKGKNALSGSQELVFENEASKPEKPEKS